LIKFHHLIEVIVGKCLHEQTTFLTLVLKGGYVVAWLLGGFGAFEMAVFGYISIFMSV
jgi:hypothetical protein